MSRGRRLLTTVLIAASCISARAAIADEPQSAVQYREISLLPDEEHPLIARAAKQLTHLG